MGEPLSLRPLLNLSRETACSWTTQDHAFFSFESKRGVVVVAPVFRARRAGGPSPATMAPPLMNHRSSLEYKRRPYIAAMATMSTPQKIRVGRRYKKAQRVLPRVLLSIVLVYVVGLCVYFGKYRVRPRHHTAPELPAVLREGEIEMASARRLLCSAAPLREDDEGAGGESGGARIAASEAPTTTTTTTTQTITPIKRGSFLGQQKVFAPGPTRVAPGQDGGGAHPAARVFLLTGASASTPGTADLLSHFLAHYVARGGVPASHVLVVIHTRGGERGDDAAATRELVALCEAAGVFFEVWEGEALLFSAVAHPGSTTSRTSRTTTTGSSSRIWTSTRR